MQTRQLYLLDEKSLASLDEIAKEFFSDKKFKLLLNILEKLDEASHLPVSNRSLEDLNGLLSAVQLSLQFSSLLQAFLIKNEQRQFYNPMKDISLEEVSNFSKKISNQLNILKSLSSEVDRSKSVIANLASTPREIQRSQDIVRSMGSSSYAFLLEHSPDDKKAKEAIDKAEKLLAEWKRHIYKCIGKIVTENNILVLATHRLLGQNMMDIRDYQYINTIRGLSTLNDKWQRWLSDNQDFVTYTRNVFKLGTSLGSLLMKLASQDKEYMTSKLVDPTYFGKNTLELSAVDPFSTACKVDLIKCLYELTNVSVVTGGMERKHDEIVKRNKSAVANAGMLVHQFDGLESDIKEYIDYVSELVNRNSHDGDRAAVVYTMGKDDFAKIKAIKPDEILGLIEQLKLAKIDASDPKAAKHIDLLLDKFNVVAQLIPRLGDLKRDYINAKRHLLQQFPELEKNAKPAMQRFFSQAVLSKPTDQQAPISARPLRRRHRRVSDAPEPDKSQVKNQSSHKSKK